MTAADERRLRALERRAAHASLVEKYHDDRHRRASERAAEAETAVYEFKKAHGLLRVPMPDAVNQARAEDIYRKLYARPR